MKVHRSLRRRSVDTDAEVAGDAAASVRADEAPRTNPDNRRVYSAAVRAANQVAAGLGDTAGYPLARESIRRVYVAAWPLTV